MRRPSSTPAICRCGEHAAATPIATAAERPPRRPPRRCRRPGRRGSPAASCRSRPSRTRVERLARERGGAQRRSTSEKTVQSFEACPSAMAGRYPPRRVGQSASRSSRRASAAASSSGRREDTSQYGAGSAGSVISTRTARLQVGPQQQVGPGVGVAPGVRRGLLGVERRRRTRGASTSIRARPARNQPSRDLEPRRRRS